MSPRYKCKDCGFAWNDVEVKKEESKFFLRCLRCESRNISFPKKVKLKTKLIIWLVISLITGGIGAGIGIWICFGLLGHCGNPWMFGLIGFLIGFFILPLLILLDYFLELEIYF